MISVCVRHPVAGDGEGIAAIEVGELRHGHAVDHQVDVADARLVRPAGFGAVDGEVADRDRHVDVVGRHRRARGRRDDLDCWLALGPDASAKDGRRQRQWEHQAPHSANQPGIPEQSVHVAPPTSRNSPRR
jgi:hypothetical protein